MKITTPYNLSDALDITRNVITGLYGPERVKYEYILPRDTRKFLEGRTTLIACSVFLSSPPESALRKGNYLEPVIAKLKKDTEREFEGCSVILADLSMMKMLASDEALRLGNASELEVSVGSNGSRFSNEKIQNVLREKLC